MDANKVIEELCSTIEATGGVLINRKGHVLPVGDPEWIDLGDVYMKACEVLGRTPIAAADPEDVEDEEIEG